MPREGSGSDPELFAQTELLKQGKNDVCFPMSLQKSKCVQAYSGDGQRC
jgi:hypothetical protein